MRKLAGPDTAFLYGERPEWHFHVSAVTILDPSTAPRPPKFADLVEHIKNRVHLVPQLRWKLMTQPAGLDRPIFVDDPDFAVRRHLRHIALPAPGDDRALGTLIGQLVSFKIDRSHPLWEMWYIEGLDTGDVAVLTKIHHSIIDGTTGTDLLTILYDVDADPTPDPPPPAYRPEPAPTNLRMAAELAGSLATWPIRTAQVADQTIRQTAAVVRHAFHDITPKQPFQAPRTSINGRLTGLREFAHAVTDLTTLKAIKNATETTVNDVVLATCGGALRSYLLDKGTLPDTPLVAQVPVSVRSAGDTEVGTKVAAMFASLATEVDDPLERLTTIQDSTISAKEMRTELTDLHNINLTDATPPLFINLAARAVTRAGLEQRLPPVFNLIVSNVPGPTFDLFVRGARVKAMYPLGPLLYGSGVNISVVSQGDRVDFGFISCPDIVDDVWNIAERIGPAVDELAEATGV